MFKNTSLVFICSMICLLLACEEETFIPKPKGYYKVPLPEKNYVLYAPEGYPYRFEIPDYSSVIKDTLFFGQAPENPWWINVDFPTLGGKIYLSYKEINANNTLVKLLEDSYKMSHYHSKRADYIDEPEFHTDHRVHGLYYVVGGNAASSLQFYATDSVKHFLRGALYFDATPNADSIGPVNEFLKADMEHLVQTLHWTR